MSLWHHVICPRSITRRDQSTNNFQLHPQLPLHAHECAHVCMHTSSTYIFPSRYQKKKGFSSSMRLSQVYRVLSQENMEGKTEKDWYFQSLYLEDVQWGSDSFPAFHLSWHLDFVKFDITQGAICLLCLLWRRKHNSLITLLLYQSLVGSSGQDVSGLTTQNSVASARVCSSWN